MMSPSPKKLDACPDSSNHHFTSSNSLVVDTATNRIRTINTNIFELPTTYIHNNCQNNVVPLTSNNLLENNTKQHSNHHHNNHHHHSNHHHHHHQNNHHQQHSNSHHHSNIHQKLISNSNHHYQQQQQQQQQQSGINNTVLPNATVLLSPQKIVKTTNNGSFQNNDIHQQQQQQHQSTAVTSNVGGNGVVTTTTTTTNSINVVAAAAAAAAAAASSTSAAAGTGHIKKNCYVKHYCCKSNNNTSNTHRVNCVNTGNCCLNAESGIKNGSTKYAGNNDNTTIKTLNRLSPTMKHLPAGGTSKDKSYPKNISVEMNNDYNSFLPINNYSSGDSYKLFTFEDFANYPKPPAPKRLLPTPPVTVPLSTAASTPTPSPTHNAAQSTAPLQKPALAATAAISPKNCYTDENMKCKDAVYAVTHNNNNASGNSGGETRFIMGNNDLDYKMTNKMDLFTFNTAVPNGANGSVNRQHHQQQQQHHHNRTSNNNNNHNNNQHHRKQHTDVISATAAAAAGGAATATGLGQSTAPVNVFTVDCTGDSMVNDSKRQRVRPRNDSEGNNAPTAIATVIDQITLTNGTSTAANVGAAAATVASVRRTSIDTLLNFPKMVRGNDAGTMRRDMQRGGIKVPSSSIKPRHHRLNAQKLRKVRNKIAHSISSDSNSNYTDSEYEAFEEGSSDDDDDDDDENNGRNNDANGSDDDVNLFSNNPKSVLTAKNIKFGCTPKSNYFPNFDDNEKWPIRTSLFPHVPPYVKFAAHDNYTYKLPPGTARYFKWRLSNITPIVVRKTIQNTGFRLIRKSNDWIGTWGKHIKSPIFQTLKESQKLNHFPGTFQIGRKDRLWKNLQRLMFKFGIKEFGFIPRTYVLPQDMKMLRQAWERSGRERWIIKPPAAARGTGIKVIHRWSHLPKKKPLIVQEYISNPYLINGSKFDLRLYVLVTSFNPLRVYLYPEGLVRFASTKYSDDLSTLNDRYMHLTNYSINKLSSHYAANEDANACKGHKWTLSKLWEYLEAQQEINTKYLWQTLQQLVIKTMLCAESSINQLFKANVNSRYNCYELFGVDVLLDEHLKPWLLEVNISPSLHSSSPLDLHVKGPLVQNLLNLAQFHLSPKLVRANNMGARAVPACLQPDLYTTRLTAVEHLKQSKFTSFEKREEYLYTILNDLTGDDVRYLIQAEDELAAIGNFERIFPTQYTHQYFRYMEPRYYNRLFDAWESRYEKNRAKGIKLLQSLCEQKVHLVVAPPIQNTLNENNPPSNLETVSDNLRCVMMSLQQPTLPTVVLPKPQLPTTVVISLGTTTTTMTTAAAQTPVTTAAAAPTPVTTATAAPTPVTTAAASATSPVPNSTIKITPVMPTSQATTTTTTITTTTAAAAAATTTNAITSTTTSTSATSASSSTITESPRVGVMSTNVITTAATSKTTTPTSKTTTPTSKTTTPTITTAKLLSVSAITTESLINKQTRLNCLDESIK